MQSSRALPILLVVSGLLLPAPGVWADQWYEHYARAEAALAEEDHQTAIDELTQALERRGDSGARVRTYGMRVTAYFPYLKLGIAYFQAGQYEAALRAFDTEERLGEIGQSDRAFAELERYRRLAVEALDERRTDQERVVEELVSQAMAQARSLQRNGLPDEAMTVVSRALSLAPENQEANELAIALRDELARRAEQQERRERAAELVEEGTRLRSDGRLADAAARFRQAMELAPGSGADRLLAEVQAELSSRSDTATSFDPVQTLGRANELLVADELGNALSIVQEVIAAFPDTPGASELERRILAKIAEQNLTAEIARLLDESRARIAAGDHEGSIAAANLVLARDRGNAAALQLITDAYGALNRRLLGAAAVQNLPPAIRFADMRVEGPDGYLVHVVRAPDFRLSGVVIDDAEVSLDISGDTGLEVSSELSSQSLGGVHITEFRIDAVLPVGRTTLDVTAIDTRGARSRSEYLVEYSRPLARSPWLWSVLIAIPLVVVVVRAARRASERRRLRRRRFNPFVAGPPVLDPDLFFGRDALLDRVLATLPNNSLLLLGERRIGKTSLLHQLRIRLHALDHPRFHFVPMYIDLQGTPESAFFATLAEAIGEAIGDERMIASRKADGYDSRELAGDLRRVLPTVECPEDKRVKLVLLLDEIDELNGYSHRTNQRLRSLFMRGFADQLVAVAAGVGISRQWDREGSPWYNFFEEMEVGPVDATSARSLVIEPLRSVIAIDQEAVDRLLRDARGRPYHLQKSALAVVQRVHEAGRRRITVADVEAVLEEQPDSKGENT